MSSSVEMDNITKDDSFAGGSSLNTRDHTYDPPPPMGRRPQQSPRSAFSGFVNSFRRDPNSPSKDATSRHPFYDRHGYYHSRRDGSASFEGGDEMEIIDGVPTNWSRHRGSVSGNGGGGGGGRYYDLHAASVKTAHSLLSRELKGRHLQMIAIGGSIGTGLFVASGKALFLGGPASILVAYTIVGIMLWCTVQALGELAVLFPIPGSFSVFSTRFLDPAWGFAMGWNYALQWLVVLPLEIIAASITIEYWNSQVNKAIFVTIFLVIIVSINLFGVKGYGEAEFVFAIAKVTAVVAFILLGIVINIGGTQNEGYIGGKYWLNPGAFHNGVKGLCSVFVAAAFAFTGTELVGLAAAETANPRKSLPTAIKQVFWRIFLFYIVSLFLVGLLVPYTEPRLLGAKTIVDASASPFVIAIESAGITVLPSVMNTVILLAVMSVGNSAIFGSSRTLAALADLGQAPRILGYVDRRGRPLVAVLAASSLGLLAYLADIRGRSDVLDWLMSLSGLSSVFTWASICLCHIRFRAAWAARGRTLDQLAFRAQAGVLGSWAGLLLNCLVLASQFWIAVWPIKSAGTGAGGSTGGSSGSTGGDDYEGPVGPSARARTFFLDFMAVPVVAVFWLAHKAWFRTPVVRIRDMDIDTGRREFNLPILLAHEVDEKRYWPRWKKVYKFLC